MLKLEIIGNLGADAIVREANGSRFLSFNVAHNRKRVNRETGEVTSEERIWVSCTLNGDGGNLLQYLRKGTGVCCHGVPHFGIYRKDGQPYVDVTLSVDSIQLMPKALTKDDERNLDLFFQSVQHLKSLGYESFLEVPAKPNSEANK